MPISAISNFFFFSLAFVLTPFSSSHFQIWFDYHPVRSVPLALSRNLFDTPSLEEVASGLSWWSVTLPRAGCPCNFEAPLWAHFPEAWAHTLHLAAIKMAFLGRGGRKEETWGLELRDYKAPGRLLTVNSVWRWGSSDVRRTWRDKCQMVICFHFPGQFCSLLAVTHPTFCWTCDHFQDLKRSHANQEAYWLIFRRQNIQFIKIFPTVQRAYSEE